MKSSDVTGAEIAARLGRAPGYVSERVNGKRALDTDDVDALAELAGSPWTGRALMIELARRVRAAEDGSGEIITVDFGVRGSSEDLREAAFETDIDHTRDTDDLYDA